MAFLPACLETVDFVAGAPDASWRPLPFEAQPLHVQLSLHGGQVALVLGKLAAALALIVTVGEHYELQGVHRWRPVRKPGSAGSVQQKRGHMHHDQQGCRGQTERLAEG